MFIFCRVKLINAVNTSYISVMSCCKNIGPQFINGIIKKLAPLNILITHNTGIRSFSGAVGIYKIINNFIIKFFCNITGIMLNSQFIRHTLSIRNNSIR